MDRIMTSNLEILTGVLLLENNKTYGRTANKRLLYKCIPNDNKLQPFLIPYEIKMEFSKKFINKYITFKFEYWSEYPVGQIIETLGNVDNLEVFYEYQLYCKGLHISNSKLMNQTRILFQQNSADEYILQILHNPQFKIEDRCQEYIITIDPPNSRDFDDGFSITPCINEKMVRSQYKISIYIANVFFWLEILDLYPYLSDRISTIYLPDKKRTMLPPILSDSLCSLQETQNRFAFTMDLIVDANGQILEEPHYCNTIIKVAKNYCYEESKLLKDAQYKLLFGITKKMQNTDYIIDSHDLVAYWMMQMNIHCSEYMIQYKFGIFRNATIQSLDSGKNPLIKAQCQETDGNPLIKAQCQETAGNPLIKAQCQETARIIQYWNNSSGQYILYSDNHKELEHAIMQLKSYIHITSPIRRIVDLLNQIEMMQHLRCIKNLSHNATAFLLKWIQKIDYINTTTKSIRKTQTECELLQKCIIDTTILGKLYDGIILHIFIKPNGKNTYSVYLESLKIIYNITICEILEIHSIYKFKLFLFQDEYNIKKKIRLQLITK